jgi:hypothetical protein
MAREQPDVCRQAAAGCLELARITTDRERKRTLLTMAQQWMKLGYSRYRADFQVVLSEFNRGQMIDRLPKGGQRRIEP